MIPERCRKLEYINNVRSCLDTKFEQKIIQQNDTQKVRNILSSRLFTKNYPIKLFFKNLGELVTKTSSKITRGKQLVENTRRKTRRKATRRKFSGEKFVTSTENHLSQI